ncbi:MAG: prepilin-type N-terminal cleavage/methylation domain-containing protein [Verrucomicrobia bacterium]|nr:prepilin-type N-terminal cleavage/methylation domain-containing protein [Verrucomicrobiota bacterium]
MRTPPKGFTATELAVALAVLAVVFLLLLPAVNMQRKKQYRQICANNLRLIGAGMLMYAQDHNMHLPTVQENRRGLWDAALVWGRYVPRESVFHCPADRIKRAGGLPRSYTYTINLEPNGRFWIEGSRLPCRYFPNPEEVVIVTESADSCNMVGEWCCSYHPNRSGGRSQHTIPSGDGVAPPSNYLFMDGHVEWADAPSTNWFPVPPDGAPFRPCP